MRLSLIDAKKKYGQNFLKDSSILEKIIQAMPNSNHDLVEIGPGLGDLTQKLLGVKPVIAYEVDAELCRYLQDTFSQDIHSERLVLQQGDVLERFRKGTGLRDKPYDLVANLPYYIATAIILEALKDPMCKTMIVMIQKEVAQKFAAAPKSKAFTSLAILANSIAKTELLFDVGADAFDPPPKVTSSVLKIEKIKEYIRSNDQEGMFDQKEELRGFERYLKQAFSAPRKTWLKNMSSCYDKNKLKNLLQEVDLLDSIRSHEISVSSHHRLYKQLTKGYSDGREEQTNTGCSKARS